jgi:DNA-binding NarL/FixJ family response regulator
VAAGETAIDPEVIERVMFRRRTADPLQRLTAGELRVLALMAEGLSNAAIAERLNYSPKTVEKRITVITHKLDLQDTAISRGDINLRVLTVLTYLRSANGPHHSSR